MSIASYAYFKSLQFKLAPEITLNKSFFTKDTNTVSISLIGDSWVADHSLDSILKNAISINNKKIQVNSNGQYGARSKDIYLNFFKSPNDPNSLQKIIDSRPDYCFISAGNNDLNMGSRYYAHHVLLMVKLLCKFEIKPIIMQLPKYESHKPQISLLEKASRFFRNMFSGSEYINDVNLFQNNLLAELNKSRLKSKVILIDINYDDSMKEYVDYTKLHFKTFHLNSIGKQLLAVEIAKAINNDYGKFKK